MIVQPDFWEQFAHDPRDPAHAALRASDRDRELVQGVLSDAYADGRLDRTELEERNDAVGRSRTLGQLPAVVADLVASTTAPARADRGLVVRPEEVVAQAVRRYEADRREAVAAFLGPSVICLVIWSIVMFGGFFWPGFVIAGTGINLLRTLVRRQDIIDRHARRLEEKQLRAIEGQQP